MCVKNDSESELRRLSRRALPLGSAVSAMREPEPQRVRALECAGVCLSWAQIWAQTQFRENFEASNLVKRMVGRDGIEPPTPGFSVLFPKSCKCA